MNPAADRPGKALFAAAMILFVLALFSAATQSLLFGVLAAFGLALSLFRVFVPTSYAIYRDRVEIGYGPLKLRHELDRFRAIVPERNGLLLSPFRRPHPLQNYRGLYLRCGPRREEVRKLLESIISAEGAAEISDKGSVQ